MCVGEFGRKEKVYQRRLLIGIALAPSPPPPPLPPPKTIVSKFVTVNKVTDKLTEAATTVAASAEPASTAAAVAGHLVQSRVNVLLSFLKNCDQITSLLGIYRHC